MKIRTLMQTNQVIIPLLFKTTGLNSSTHHLRSNRELSPRKVMTSRPAPKCKLSSHLPNIYENVDKIDDENNKTFSKTQREQLAEKKAIGK